MPPGAGDGFAAGHEIGEADFVDAGEIRLFDPGAFDDFLDIEAAPADAGDGEFDFAPIHGFAVGGIADEPLAGGGFEDDAKVTEAGLFGAPADFGLAGEIDEGRFMAEGDGPVAVGCAGPDVEGIVGWFVVMAFLDAVAAGAMEGEDEVGVGDVVLGDGSGGFGLLPVFAEEEGWAVLVGESESGGEEQEVAAVK